MIPYCGSANRGRVPLQARPAWLRVTTACRLGQPAGRPVPGA
jgi:hypothetical protein